MARSGQPGRTKLFKASYVDKLIVGAVDGSQIEPAKATKPAQSSQMEPAWNAIGSQERPEAVPGASREYLGASPERPSSARGSPR